MSWVGPLLWTSGLEFVIEVAVWQMLLSFVRSRYPAEPMQALAGYIGLGWD